MPKDYCIEALRLFSSVVDHFFVVLQMQSAWLEISPTTSTFMLTKMLESALSIHRYSACFPPIIHLYTTWHFFLSSVMFPAIGILNLLWLLGLFSSQRLANREFWYMCQRSLCWRVQSLKIPENFAELSRTDYGSQNSLKVTSLEIPSSTQLQLILGNSGKFRLEL